MQQKRVRQIDHKYQKDKKPFFSSFNNIKANTDNKEVAVKEIIRPVSPERKYRTARKIDNWDEINTYLTPP